jgi:hypothetical protein
MGSQFFFLSLSSEEFARRRSEIAGAFNLEHCSWLNEGPAVRLMAQEGHEHERGIVSGMCCGRGPQRVGALGP